MFLISYFLGRKTNLLCGRPGSNGFGLGHGFLFFYFFLCGNIMLVFLNIKSIATLPKKSPIIAPLSMKVRI